MGGLVQQKRGALDLVAGCRNRTEQNGLLAQERRAGVLHASVREARDQHQVVLGEGKCAIEVFSQVPDSLTSDPQDLGRLLSRAVEFRLAHEQPQALAGNRSERPGGERE